MYGLIGKKLSHSFSAEFFNQKFRKEGIDESYILLPIPDISEFPVLIEKHPDLKGLNVTIPYKEEVISFLDRLSPEAEEIGAVNVIKFLRDKDTLRLEGFNTDVIGFRKSLLPLLNENIKHALILGTGGASKAAAYALKDLGISFNFVSRKPGKEQLAYEDLTPEIMKHNLLIVNTTPLGMFPDVHGSPPIPYEYLSPRHLCFDLVYNPDCTEFMKKSMAKGATVKNGLEMLHLQALAAWDIWKS